MLLPLMSNSKSPPSQLKLQRFDIPSSYPLVRFHSPFSLGILKQLRLNHGGISIHTAHAAAKKEDELIQHHKITKARGGAKG